MNTYLTNTFSPRMLRTGASAYVSGLSPREAMGMACAPNIVDCISHDVTASIFSGLLGRKVEHTRVDLSLEPGDQLICLIPNFRANEAREFTYDEVASSGVLAYLIQVA